MQKQIKQFHFKAHERFWKIFYNAIFFLGSILMVCEISIYRKTVIPLYIPLSIVLIVGSIAFFLSGKHYKAIYIFSNNFFPIVQSLLSWGSIACYLFMASNYYLADKQTTIYSFAIERKSSMPGPSNSRGKRQPLATISYFGFEKELVFRYSDTDKFNISKNIKVLVKKGGLGFDIFDILFIKLIRYKFRVLP